MPKDSVRRSKKKSKKRKIVKKEINKKLLTPSFKHEFLVDQSEDTSSPLYYMLIFFTLFLMLGAIYAGFDSRQRFQVSKIDSFDKCLLHPKSIIAEIYPRLCTTLDGRSFFETIVNPTQPPVVEDEASDYTLTLPEGWLLNKTSYDAQDDPAIWLVPSEPDYTDGFRFPHEVIIGGKSVLFVSGGVCATSSCELDENDSIVFGGNEYPVRIFSDSSSPDIPRHTFQVETDEEWYITASFYNKDQLKTIKDLLTNLDKSEVQDILDGLYMKF